MSRLCSGNGQPLSNKTGFTLIELLAVIVILAIVAVIATPIILNVIDSSKESAFKESVNQIFHAYEIYEASHKFEAINGRIDITDPDFPLDAKGLTGEVSRNANGDIVVSNVTDGTYSATGTSANLSTIKGSVEELRKLESKLKLNTNKVTTNSITVTVTVEEGSMAVETYEYAIGTGQYKTGTNKYTFDKLDAGEIYTVYVRATNVAGVETIIRKDIKTLDIELPTYAAPEGDDWVLEKTITITYPTVEGQDLTYEYSKDRGHSWKPATQVQEVTFTENGTLIARVRDGVNVKTATAITVDKIDTEVPVIEKVEGNTDSWSQNKTLVVTATDSESGVKEYSFDNGANWQTSNEKTVTENGTYEVIVRDNVGKESTAKEVIVSKIDTEEPEASIKVTGTTTKSISVEATCSAPSGISKYEFSSNNGVNYTDNETDNTYTFSPLSTGTYNIKVRCTSGSGKENEGSTNGTTAEFDGVTFNVETGWKQSKNVTISYPEGYTYEYQIQSGSAKDSEENELTVGTWYTTTNATEILTYTSVGTVVARISDGENSKSYSEGVTEIDTTDPTISLGTVSTTSNEITIPATISDAPSGLVEVTCKYSTTENTYTTDCAQTHTDSAYTFTISNVNNTVPYYYQICAKDEANNTKCVNNQKQASSINKPSITYQGYNAKGVADANKMNAVDGYVYTDVATVVFDNTNVTTPNYYIKSTEAGTSNINISTSCTGTTEPGTCSSITATKNIQANTWYKVSGNLTVTYNHTTVDYDKNAILTAYTYDSSGNKEYKDGTSRKLQPDSLEITYDKAITNLTTCGTVKCAIDELYTKFE